MSKLIRIQSTITISVTAGLQNKDVTNPDAHVPDRLKVSPEWPKLTCLIKEGVGNYPIEIKDWATVQALAKDKIITIGEEVDNGSTEENDVAETLSRNLEEVKNEKKQRRRSAATLEDIVNE